ncbi:hypothetical protein XELAEV_18002792mg [Xenopus laevis]|nr:hypothetical protein XELAEV_18002792mg [Xenopus laevis]
MLQLTAGCIPPVHTESCQADCTRDVPNPKFGRIPNRPLDSVHHYYVLISGVTTGGAGPGPAPPRGPPAAHTPLDLRGSVYPYKLLSHLVEFSELYGTKQPTEDDITYS